MSLSLAAGKHRDQVFGSTRRSVEGLLAQAEAQRFQLEAAYLTLTSGMSPLRSARLASGM